MRLAVVIRLASAVSAVALAAAALWVLAGSTVVQPDAETLAVRASAEGAIRTLYFDAFPPASYSVGPLPSAIGQSIRDRVTGDIERYFAPPLQARYEPMILAAVDQIGSGTWDVQGNLSIDWGQATITGDQATISFRADEWLIRRGADPQLTSRAPWRIEGSWDWQLTLVRRDGRWKVDTVDSRCAADCP
jgi:hypothetical protein